MQIFYQSEEIWAGSYSGRFSQFVVLLYFVWVDMGDFGTGLTIVPHPFQGRTVLQTLLGQGTPVMEAKKVRLDVLKIKDRDQNITVIMMSQNFKLSTRELQFVITSAILIG